MDIASPTVSCRTLDESLILHDAASGQALRLNATAALIFMLCDGATPRSEILKALQQAFPSIEEAQLREDLDRTLSDLRTANVIAPVDVG